ncbi:hypothetical protein BIV03_00435 [Curtobacterium sp. MCBA15_016]|uniref:SLATT domain-containing protein n=1 Tax=Curtobacterium sp. MCBA15_016 TaxID=1898740 RepID=UPI0008DE1722|nr:SLATT domain-containing protein [Curtobacterium sp. MCBA15_016]OII28766.1 hypothetical protein BIV03_00435 [Curtobacterium sp. MCBA15_016]
MLDEIRAEASRVEENATFGQQGNLEASKGWSVLGWVLGSVIAAGSAVGGVMTFASGDLQYVGAVLALVAAATTGVHGTLRPARRSERARVAAVQFGSVRDRARRLRTVDVVSGDDVGALRQRLDVVGEELTAASRAADPTPRWAYLRAKRNIEVEHGQTHRIDR